MNFDASPLKQVTLDGLNSRRIFDCTSCLTVDIEIQIGFSGY